MDICKTILDAVENPNWRVWKIKDYDNKTIQSKYPLSKPEDLWKFIQQAQNPKALYVSVSKFLNAELTHGAFYRQNFKLSDGTHMFPREGYIISDNIMIDTDLFIDLDNENDLTVAQDDGQKIINYMCNKPEYMLSLLQFSARKGVHLGYTFLNKPKIPDPIKRMEYYKEIKGRLAKELIKLGLKTIDNFHIEVIKNNFCVFAAPYSIKDNGNIVTPLDKTEFMQKDIYDILRSKRLTAILERSSKTSEANQMADDDEVATVEVNTSTHHCQAGERLSGLSSQPIKFKFTDSMVNGLDNTYITVIKKHRRIFRVDMLKRLQKAKNLSDFIIVKIGDYMYSYNCKITDFEGELKILKNIKSENIRYFIKRRHLPIQLSNSYYSNGDEADKVEFMGILKSAYGLEHHHSLPHCRLFGLEYKNMVGKEWSNDQPCHIGMMRIR